jgi:predicted NBD/HSP70 family sugar kinase
VLVLHLGWGIGMGMILNGKPYRGARGFSGEFAHIPMSEDKNFLCSCGKRGCLETVASGATLTRLAVEAINRGEMTLIRKMAHEKVEDINPALILQAVKEGDQFAVSILSRIGFELGKGISSLMQILNPEMIILAGPLANAENYLLTSIEQALQQYSFPIIREKMELTVSGLGKDSGMLGNVINVMENILGN